jgi:hypothetical protein
MPHPELASDLGRDHAAPKEVSRSHAACFHCFEIALGPRRSLG